MVELKEEASGILAWLVRGCIEWQRVGGLNPPESVLESTAEYRGENNSIQQFVEDRCVVGENSVLAGVLYEKYVEYCKKSGFEAYTQSKFGRIMGEKFKKKRGSRVVYQDIRLRTFQDDHTSEDYDSE